MPPPNQHQGQCQSISHVTFIVGNAKMTAQYYCNVFGFRPFRYFGLETGNRTEAGHAVKLNSIIFVFISPLMTNAKTEDLNQHLVMHGDSVKDVAFNVDHLEVMIDSIRERGGDVLRVWSECDSHGLVRFATVKAPYGDVTHTLVERNHYPSERFLPGWQESPLTFLLKQNVIWSELPPVGLQFIDHVAVNQHEGTMQPIVKWYENTLRFHRFWSVDDTVINTGFSGLRSTFITNQNDEIKMPINEPGKGNRISQIEEYLEYNNGPGIQHIALYTNDICETVRQLKERGVEFLTTPDTYYTQLKQRLESSAINVTQDLVILQKLQLLVDFDDEGYLLQILPSQCKTDQRYF